MFIDSHSHIFDEAFDTDRSEVVSKAIAAGVLYQVMPNVDSTTTQRLLNTTNEFNCCFPLMGLHPTSVNNNFAHELSIVEHELQTAKFYGIGEIGIDLYWDKTFINEQIEVFRYQLKLAKKLHLPVAIHVRSAFDEVFSVLDSEIDSDLKGVFHCFSGTWEQYRHIVDYKTFMLGIGGVITYKNGGIDKFANKMDPSIILLETDSPYLSPVPVRGTRNEPFNITYTAAKLASIMGISVLELAQISTKNTIELFQLPIVQQ